MKKDRAVPFTKIIYLLFLIGTIISIFIVYKNIKNIAAIGFIIGYVIFTFFFLLYITFITMLNLRKVKFIELRGNLFKFIIIFVVLGSLNYVFDYVFRPSKVDLLREFSIPFGWAFGISFIDVIFLKKKEI